ncbi:lipase family protein [Bradyrhizobium sp.]|uniref:lipase family protein n=1 Tax=Bradyrhizobium sp. TaxID=376 RepID=UPI003C770287
MSFLVKLPTERYDPDAFKQFVGGQDFEIGNARAMAWMSQLAYETDEPDKIADILNTRGLALADGGVLIRKSKTALPIANTHCFVASHNPSRVLIVAFAGTDPLSLANWISDFDARLDKTTGAAEGYEGAADAVWDDLKKLLGNFIPADGRVFVTGHSLGGALAALIARRIATELSANVDAVYTFGMPRPGSRTFADAYNRQLGLRTFRMVHGDDIVPTVAPSSFGFRHLGRFLHCARQGKFSKADLAADTSSDLPLFTDDVARSFRDHLNGSVSAVIGAVERARLAAALETGADIAGMRTDPAGILIELLPPRLRDHMPDRYIGACTAPASAGV